MFLLVYVRSTLNVPPLATPPSTTNGLSSRLRVTSSLLPSLAGRSILYKQWAPLRRLVSELHEMRVEFLGKTLSEAQYLSLEFMDEDDEESSQVIGVRAAGRQAAAAAALAS